MMCNWEALMPSHVFKLIRNKPSNVFPSKRKKPKQKISP